MQSLTSNDEVIVGRKGVLRTLVESDSAPTDVGEVEHETDTIFGNSVYTSDYFTEKSLLLSLLSEIILETAKGESPAMISYCRLRFVKILSVIEKYREDPVLLDPHIVDLLKPVVGGFLLSSIDQPGWSTVSALMCSFVYIVSSICGYKNLLSSEVFPHDFSLLNKVLLKFEQGYVDTWESVYVLMLWLSVLVQVPFEFASIGVDPARLHALARFKDNKSVLKASSVLFGRLAVRSPDISSISCAATLRKVLAFTPPSALKEETLVELLLVGKLANTKEEILLTGSLLSLLFTITASPNKHLSLLEDCLDQICALKSSRNGDIRSAVAKSLARIFHPLPKVYQSQLLEYLVPRAEADLGGLQTECLFLGHAVRASDVNLLQSESLLLSKINASLVDHFGAISLSREVRDSGCALVWSIARSGNKHIPVELILPNLLNLCLFDRDINLRRAGAAALQELVGRVGTAAFPFGLVLLREIDFWSVACLRRTFVEIPLILVQSEESIRTNLRDKILSPFPPIQLLAAEGLANLGGVNDLEEFCRIAVTPDSEVGHRFGSIHLVKWVLLKSARDSLSLELCRSVRNLVPLIEKRRLFRGKGGDKIRVACYELIAAMLDFFEILEEKFVCKVLQIISDGIVHLVDSVQAAAIEAWKKAARTSAVNQMQNLISSYVERISLESDLNVSCRRGMIWALAVLPANLVSDLQPLFEREALQWPVHSVSRDLIDPLARKYALLGCASKSVTLCLEDFQTDNRGDVGSWVRELAVDMVAIQLEEFELEKRVNQIVCLVAHCCERLDRVRIKALTRLHALANQQSSVEILKPFRADPIPNWQTDPTVFDRVLAADCSDIVLIHYVAALATSGSLALHAERSLLKYMETKNCVPQLIALLTMDVSCYGVRFHNDRFSRLTLPLLNALTVLVAFMSVSEIEAVHEFIAAHRNTAFSSILQVHALKAFGKFIVKTLPSGQDFLVNKILLAGMPTVRYSVAQELLLVLDDDATLDLIDQTDWLSEDSTEWMETLGRLAESFGVKLEAISEEPQNRRSAKLLPDYAEFIKEEYG